MGVGQEGRAARRWHHQADCRHHIGGSEASEEKAARVADGPCPSTCSVHQHSTTPFIGSKCCLLVYKYHCRLCKRGCCDNGQDHDDPMWTSCCRCDSDTDLAVFPDAGPDLLSSRRCRSLSASFGKGQSFSVIVIVGHYRSLVQSVCWIPVNVSMRKRNSSS